MRPHHLVTHPRALHPVAWWLWAIGLGAAASRTLNPVPLVVIIAVTWFVVSARRGDTPWASSYALFFKLAMFVVRSEEHTSELQSLMRKSYAVFCLKKKKHT